jgi:hypothetical protein
MESKVEELRILENKVKQDPRSPKRAAWDDQIHDLREKLNRAKNANVQPVQTKRRELKTNARKLDQDQNSNKTYNTVPKDESLAADLKSAVADYMASIVDADVGAVRAPDSLSENTGLYHSVVQVPIKVDPTVNSGQFRGIVQPILGSLIKPRDYFLALPNESSNNFTIADAFQSNLGGEEIRIDPETIVLNNCSDSQNTYTGTLNIDGSTTNIFPPSATLSGVNNEGYAFYPQGVFDASLGFTPVSSVFVMPSGPKFHTLQMAWGDDAGSWFGPNGAFANAVGTQLLDIVIDVFAFNEVTATNTIVDRVRIQYNQFTGVTLVNQPDTSLLTYVTGSINAPQGNAQFQGFFNATFYTNYYSTSTEIFYMTWEIAQTPLLIAPADIKWRWDVNSTPVGDVLQCDDSILQKYRVTAQKVHFKCTLSDFNNSGEVALNFLQGGAQESLFTVAGGNKLSFESLSNNNLPQRSYAGCLKDGFYGFWVPDNSLDIQLRTYLQSLLYAFPCFAFAGNWTPTGASPGLVTIGYLRIVTNYEYTTVSRIIDTQAQPGTDAYIQAMQGALADIPKVMENPKHKSTLLQILRNIGTGVGTLMNAGRTVVALGRETMGLMNSIGML